jgi:pyruvate/2-oxoglutarate dehydrogenase complex dihydrolipoamide dehydrogenase (E3) component
MYQVVVLGGGPAGVTAALRASELGAKVALIERGRLGGICTNDGCVPTRVLAKAARLVREAGQFADYGLMLDAQPAVDFEQVIRRTQQVVYQVHEKKQLLDHLQSMNVDVFDIAGNAHFVDANTVELADGRNVQGERFIICVGGSARRLDFPGSEYALTHSDVWTMSQLPASIAIVGGGATGCQLASIFNAFGSKVALLDIAPKILLTEDDSVAELVRQQFVEHGIEIHTGIQGIERIEKQENGLFDLVYKHDGQEKRFTANAVILSVGWPGNIRELNLDAAGIKHERGYIQTDDYLRTSAPHIYAAGDITGRMLLVQSASYQARIAVENALLDEDRAAQHRLVPHGGFTDPEYGGVGLTEAQAREKYDCAVAVVPYADLDRAVVDGLTVGHCKLIVDRQTHLILGAHVVGEQAVEVVQMIAAGMAGGLNVQQLADLELAYPTFSSIVGLTARQLVRELELVPVAREWYAMTRLRPAEWERSEY